HPQQSTSQPVFAPRRFVLPASAVRRDPARASPPCPPAGPPRIPRRTSPRCASLPVLPLSAVIRRGGTQTSGRRRNVPGSLSLPGASTLFAPLSLSRRDQAPRGRDRPSPSQAARQLIEVLVPVRQVQPDRECYSP